MQYYLKALRNYTGFTGRSTRSEYWYFALFNFIFAIAAMIVDNVLGTRITTDTINGAFGLPYGYVYLLYALAVIIPGLAVAVRRLHDVNKSGWFLLIAIIPIVGIIWLLVLMVTDSDPGENKYGMNPQAIPIQQY